MNNDCCNCPLLAMIFASMTDIKNEICLIKKQNSKITTLLKNCCKDKVKNWQPKQTYVVGDIVSFGGNIYVCIKNHESKPSETPPTSPTLWTLI